jgi:hypothetical protein
LIIMGLYRTALRLATLEALRPSGLLASDGPWPTLAGKHVFDSCIDPIEDLPVERATPVIVVYTEKDDGRSGQYAGGPPFLQTVDLVFEISRIASIPRECALWGVVAVHRAFWSFPHQARVSGVPQLSAGSRCSPGPPPGSSARWRWARSSGSTTCSPPTSAALFGRGATYARAGFEVLSARVLAQGALPPPASTATGEPLAMNYGAVRLGGESGGAD